MPHVRTLLIFFARMELNAAWQGDGLLIGLKHHGTGLRRWKMHDRRNRIFLGFFVTAQERRF